MKEYLFYSILALVFVAFLYIKLSNIDMTQTRLFIEFWYAWLCGTVVVILDYLFLGKNLN